MIAKSDLIILVVSASALAVGVFRWQQNTAAPEIVMIPASSRTVVEAPLDPNANAAAERTVAGAPLERDEAAAAGADDTLVVRRLPPAGDGGNAPDGADEASAGTAPGGERRATDGNTVTDGGVRPADRPAGDEALATRDAAAGEALYGRYRVRSGDYLGRIAERFGTSVSTLRSINGIEGNLILVDQELRYPLPAN